jgi:hypothetical protein
VLDPCDEDPSSVEALVVVPEYASHADGLPGADGARHEKSDYRLCSSCKGRLLDRRPSWEVWGPRILPMAYVAKSSCSDIDISV